MNARRELYPFNLMQAASAWWRHRAHRTAGSTIFHYAGTFIVVVVATELVHRSALGSPVSGVVSMGVVLICAWFGGLGPALLLSPLLLLLARLHRDAPDRWTAMPPQELLALTIITLLSASIGLAGQYRRRVRDVTELHSQQLQDQARALNQAAISFRDVGGRITQWSEGCERLFGYSRLEAVGRIQHDLLRTRFTTPWEDIQQPLMHTGQWQGELVQHHKDGHELHIATQCVLYRDKASVPIGVAEICTDVTALRHAEGAIREADRRKEHFLAMLAHELRNPLAPIRNGLQLLEMAQDDPQVLAETRGIMQRQLEQLVTIVDDLLDISRITRGRLEIRKSQVSAAEIVEEAVAAIKPALEVAKHRLVVNTPEDVLWLDADRHRMTQVVTNVLDNAVKYTPPGGEISLTVSRRGNHVAIAVKDTGVGISSEMLERIFEMFTRVENNSSLAGLGIGLALVKSIAEMHGGTVQAHSEGPGLGTEVCIQLPLLVCPAETVEQPSLPGSVIAAPRRVLVVDDNQSAAGMLSALMKQLGNIVLVAHDGQQAVDLASSFRPDLVLMDLGMPGVDGYAAARQMREEPWGRDMMLVALTGWGQDKHKQLSKAAGFDHHLVKPADVVKIQQLLSTISPAPGHNGVAS